MTLTPREVARALDCEMKEIEALVRTQELVNVGYGHRCRLDPEQVAAWISDAVSSGDAPHQALVALARLLRQPR